VHLISEIRIFLRQADVNGRSLSKIPTPTIVLQKGSFILDLYAVGYSASQNDHETTLTAYSSSLFPEEYSFTPLKFVYFGGFDSKSIPTFCQTIG
jgi:hypothetical protein